MAQTGNEFKAEVELQFTNLEAVTAQLSNSLAGALKSGATATGDMGRKMAEIVVASADLGNFLKKASSDFDLKTAQEAMILLAKKAAELGKLGGKAVGIGVVDAAKVQAATRELKQYERAMEAAQNKTIKTTLASQNIIRVVQDAPFGMMGIANNLEQLSESFGSLLKQTGSVSGALKAMFLPLVTGPMAIPFVMSLITMFALSWDKLALQIDKAKVALGLMTQAQAEFNAEREKFKETGVKDIISGLKPEDLFFAEENLERAQDENTKRFKEIRESILRETGKTVEEIEKIMETQAAMRAGGGKAGGGLKAMLPPDVEALVAQYERAKPALDKLANDRRLINEGMERVQKAQMLDEDEFQLRNLLNLPEDSEIDAETKDKEKKVRDFDLVLAQARIDGMQEGLEKTLAQVRLNGEKERRALTEEFGKREDLTVALEEKVSRAELNALVDNQNKLIAAENAAWEKRMRAEEARRKEELEARKKAIVEANAISMFGIKQQLSTALSQIDRNDPFAAERASALAKFESEMQEISATRSTMEAELRAGLLSQAAYNAELASLLAQEALIRKQYADRTKAIEEEKRDVLMGVAGQITNNAADMFGSLNILAQKEGAKGLEETKKFLFAQAVAEAIAAGISATQAILSIKGIPPGARIAMAFSAGAAITAKLMAAAKQIKSIGLGGGAAAQGITGQFTTLNTSVSGQRVTAFERQQALDTRSASNGGVKEAIEGMSENIENLAQRVADSRVVYDDRTAAHIVQRGGLLNKRLTGKSDAGV